MFKLLVVEDDRELNRAVCSFLKQNGYDALGCLSANEAYDALYGGNVYDLIISDIMMPEIDGFEFASTIRDTDKNIPILFMTARDDFAAKQRGFRMGIDDYMVKPIDFEELLLHVGALLRRAGIATSRKLEIGSLVLDADGLNTLAGDNDLAGFVQGFNGRVVLTPHVGEARRLLAALGDEETASREDMVRVLSEGYGAIAVMKGAQTLVAQSQEETGIWRNTTGNPGMATAGSGDVLTGVIASLAGQGLSLWDAARAGVWLHGAAGDLAADDKGEYGMIAGDIVDHLPYAIKRLF